jgi:hypothetical protein
MMSTSRTPTEVCRSALLAVLAAGVVTAAAPAAPPEGGKDALLPGARLLHKFPKEVYRTPVLLATDQGPRLLLWVDAFDPAAPTRFPGERPREPQFDLTFWDVTAGKEVHKLSFPKEPLPPILSSNYTMTIPPAELAISPDGKQLACVSTTSRPVPGKVVHETTGQIKLYDLKDHKWQPAIPPEVLGPTSLSVLFAPDGALVVLKETSCLIQEPGKDKPRLSFELARSSSYKTIPVYYAVQDAVLSPDGSLLAVALDGMVTVYDVTEGKKLFDADRATPEAKTTFGQNTVGVSLAFAPSQSEQKLLAVEVVKGPPKSFVLARLFDLKEKKEAGRFVLAEEETKGDRSGLNQKLPAWGGAHACFTPRGEPRVLFDGKLIDGASGKALQRFDEGRGLLVSRDGKYLVRLTGKKDDKKMGVEVWSLDSDK